MIESSRRGRLTRVGTLALAALTTRCAPVPVYVQAPPNYAGSQPQQAPGYVDPGNVPDQSAPQDNGQYQPQDGSNYPVAAQPYGYAPVFVSPQPVCYDDGCFGPTGFIGEVLIGREYGYPIFHGRHPWGRAGRVEQNTIINNTTITDRNISRGRVEHEMPQFHGVNSASAGRQGAVVGGYGGHAAAPDARAPQYHMQVPAQRYIPAEMPRFQAPRMAAPQAIRAAPAPRINEPRPAAPRVGHDPHHQ